MENEKKNWDHKNTNIYSIVLKHQRDDYAATIMTANDLYMTKCLVKVLLRKHVKVFSATSLISKECDSGYIRILYLFGSLEVMTL